MSRHVYSAGHDHSEHEHEHEHKHEHGKLAEHEPLPCDGEGHEHHHHPDGSCCCHHHDEEYHGINKIMLARLIVSAALFAAGHFLEAYEPAIMIAAALIAGYDVIIEAVKNLFGRRVFDEYFLMTFAVIAAFAIGEYEEAAAVMVLYRIGESCQSYAIRHSRRTLSSFSGAQASDAGLGGEREKFITKFARVYTPVILVLAAAEVAILPLAGAGISFSEALYRALSFIVLACPCAVVISVPLAYFAGIISAAKRNIFFQDSTGLDALAKDRDALEHFSSRLMEGSVCSIYEGGAVIIRGDGVKPEAAVAIARKARRIAFENIVFVIAMKLAVIILSIAGFSELWFAVFADSGVAVLATLNSLRAFSVNMAERK